MSSVARLPRQKISTTISPAALEYLDGLVKKDDAQNLAGAIDLAIERLLAFENRERLENDTAAYFANLSEKEAAEERSLETALSQSAWRSTLTASAFPRRGEIWTANLGNPPIRHWVLI